MSVKSDSIRSAVRMSLWAVSESVKERKEQIGKEQYRAFSALVRHAVKNLDILAEDSTVQEYMMAGHRAANEIRAAAWFPHLTDDEKKILDAIEALLPTAEFPPKESQPQE